MDAYIEKFPDSRRKRPSLRVVGKPFAILKCRDVNVRGEL